MLLAFSHVSKVTRVPERHAALASLTDIETLDKQQESETNGKFQPGLTLQTANTINQFCPRFSMCHTLVMVARCIEVQRM
jgi:hypothetical protein